MKHGRGLAAILPALVAAGVLAGCGGIEARRLEAEKAAAIRAEQERRAEERYALETACEQGDAGACAALETEENETDAVGGRVAEPAE